VASGIAFQEPLHACGDICRFDAEFRRSLLAVCLQVTQLIGQHDGSHDLQGGTQVGGPVAVAEISHELVKERAIFRLDGEAKGLCTHTVKCNELLLICNILHSLATVLMGATSAQSAGSWRSASLRRATGGPGSCHLTPVQCPDLQDFLCVVGSLTVEVAAVAPARSEPGFRPRWSW
jgi:hypothetical protein